MAVGLADGGEVGGACARFVKDYKRKAQTSETLIEIAASRSLLRRLGRCQVEHQQVERQMEKARTVPTSTPSISASQASLN